MNDMRKKVAVAHRMCACLVGVFAIHTALAADAIAWPTDYESKLASHVQAMKPSGEQVDESATWSAFDSVVFSEGIAILADLRNYVARGFLLLFH